MSKLPESVQNQLLQGIAAFQAAAAETGYSHFQIDLDCGTLPDPRWIKTPKDWPAEIYEAGLLDSFFHQLPENDLPCLYRFEVLSHDLCDVLPHYREYRDQAPIHKRATGSLKKWPPTVSRTLYVGKVKNDIRGRMAVHLGYYHVGKTAGLQLACWAKSPGLKLRVHVFAFQKEMEAFVSSLELEYARHHQPMIGKQ